MLNVQNEVQIGESIVLLLSVIEPGLVLGLKLKAIQVADETTLLDISLGTITSVTHVCKGIDNDTEDQVEKDNDDQEEESQVKDISFPVVLPFFVEWQLIENLTYTTASSQTIVKGGGKAFEKCLAVHVLLRCIFSGLYRVRILVALSKVHKRHERVDIDYREEQNKGIEKLFPILDDGLDHILEERNLNDYVKEEETEDCVIKDSDHRKNEVDHIEGMLGVNLHGNDEDLNGV